MKRYTVKVTDQAWKEFALANAWWIRNRTAASALLRSEFRAACELLATHPEVAPLDSGQGQKIRRLVLPKAPYIVYYRVDHDQERVRILSFWHAQRLPPEL